MKLSVNKRNIFKKKLKTLRKEWLVPGIIYSKHIKTSIPISFKKLEFIKLYKQIWYSTTLNLEWDWIKEMVLIYNIQKDPVKDYLLHVDFLAVKADEKVEAEVKIILKWESQIEKLGEWNVEQVKYEVLVEAFPNDLPANIEVDISNIKSLNDGMFLSDLDLWDKVEIKENLELAILTVVKMMEEEVEEETAEEEVEREEKSESKEWDDKWEKE